ncbi:hypothetical protein AKJ37_06635 [candidate division MSBL1 archaeon SCGC-AAA259I09]|uniref:Aldehyde ferredoxin oxidoreductase C-terminal domain-containing protein n=1 Tax=candidate division MSBL1 archaeon SCGC-AAA259I09 TaxID=1698267 RepID=A0A133UNI2_9EURY|nr:hypothetical protein AKJ37_06635 [candidate division MSBL1 archaeon SCGC-AAA259I09]
MEKAYNVREGLGIEDDVMPERTYSEPAPSGVRKGKSIEGIFEEMREEYYEARNWDKETGLPTREKLRELDLDAITSDNSRIS